MLDLIAKCVGRKRGCLIDHDGERTIRWAKRFGSIYRCYRWGIWAPRRIVDLHSDGTTTGISYVVRWEEMN